MAQQGSVNAYYVKAIRALILNGDSIKFTNPQDGDVISRVSGVWKNTPGSGYSAVDSLEFNKLNGRLNWYIGGSVSDYTNVDGRYILLSDSSKYIAKRDSGLTYLTPNQVNSLINDVSPLVIYEIRLPSSTTVSGRISGATSGVDYPSGWVLTVGTTPTDLIVTHGLNRRVASVTVFAITGTEEQQLFNTASYNGIITTDANTLKIQSLATIQKAIKIYISFK